MPVWMIFLTDPDQMCAPSLCVLYLSSSCIAFTILHKHSLVPNTEGCHASSVSLEIPFSTLGLQCFLDKEPESFTV